MKYFIKNKKGKLIEVTKDQAANLEEQLYDEEGKEVELEKEKVEASNINTGVSAVEELTGLFKDMASSLNEVKEVRDDMTEKIKAYQEAQKRGLVLPVAADKGMSASDVDEIFKDYDLKRQGSLLLNRFKHPYVISDEKREELAKYFLLVVMSGVHGSTRAQSEFFNRYGSNVNRERKTGTTGLGASGNNSFPVPDIVEAEILAYARESSVAMQYARMVDMVSEKQSYPVEATGVAVTWGGTTSESSPTATEAELTASELSAFSEVRKTLLADTRSDIVSWLMEMMAESVGLELDNQVFNGTGSPVSGIMTALCGYSVNMGTGSTAFSQISHSQLSETISKLDGLRKRNARFFMHGSILHYVRLLADDNSRPIFLETIGSAIPPQIYGYPYSEVTNMPSTSATATAFIGFGNLQHFMIGRRLDTMTLEVNTQANTPFTTNTVWFKIYNRWALTLALPNGFVRVLTAGA